MKFLLFVKGYEVVESLNVKLPPRPNVSRGPPLTSPEWKEFLDPEGRVTRVAELRQRVFRGVSFPFSSAMKLFGF